MKKNIFVIVGILFILVDVIAQPTRIPLRRLQHAAGSDFMILTNGSGRQYYVDKSAAGIDTDIQLRDLQIVGGDSLYYEVYDNVNAAIISTNKIQISSGGSSDNIYTSDGTLTDDNRNLHGIGDSLTYGFVNGIDTLTMVWNGSALTMEANVTNTTFNDAEFSIDKTEVLSQVRGGNNDSLGLVRIRPANVRLEANHLGTKNAIIDLNDANIDFQFSNSDFRLDGDPGTANQVLMSNGPGAAPGWGNASNSSKWTSDPNGMHSDSTNVGVNMNADPDYNFAVTGKMFLDDGGKNLAIGNGALDSLTTGLRNLARGYQAARSNESANDLVVDGHQAAYYSKVQINARGSYAGFYNDYGLYNDYSGYRAGFSGKGILVEKNTFRGYNSGYNNQGRSNSFYGNFSGFFHVWGDHCTFIGNVSGEDQDSVQYATAVGDHSGQGEVADYTSMLGSFANSTHPYGIALGYNVATDTAGQIKVGREFNTTFKAGQYFVLDIGQPLGASDGHVLTWNTSTDRASFQPSAVTDLSGLDSDGVLFGSAGGGVEQEATEFYWDGLGLFLKASNTTTSNKILTLKASDNATMFKVTYDGAWSFGGPKLFGRSAGDADTPQPNNNNRGLSFRAPLGLGFPTGLLNIKQDANNNYGGTSNTLKLEGTFNPSSSTHRFNAIEIKNVIDQSGGTATGISSGVYVSSTLTSAVDHRAFDTNVNSGFAYHQDGANAINHFAGKSGFGSAITTPTHMVEAGDFNSGNGPASNTYLATNNTNNGTGDYVSSMTFQVNSLDKAIIQGQKVNLDPLAGRLHLSTTNNLGAVVRALTIDDNQNVGIGTTFPTSELEVVGNIELSGNIILDLANNVILAAGSGSPEGVLTAGVGSTYSRTDGGAGTSFYVKESGSGNTGWVAK